MFDGEDQRLFRLTELIKRCRLVWEERAQALPRGVINLREVEPQWRCECENGGDVIEGFELSGKKPIWERRDAGLLYDDEELGWFTTHFVEQS